MPLTVACSTTGGHASHTPHPCPTRRSRARHHHPDRLRRWVADGHRELVDHIGHRPAHPDPPPASTDATVPDAEPMPSRWDDVLDGIGDDGEVSLELALDAFSLGVAPLPGNELRRADTDAAVPDASSAVAWVLRHFDQLSAEQQAAVAVALSPEDQLPPTPGTSGLRTTSAASKRASTVGCYGQVIPTADSPDAGPYRAVLDEVSAEISSRLGGAISLVAPAYLLLDHRDLGLGLAYTWADPGDCEQNGMSTCTIHLSADAADEAPTELRGILAHEMMHCYQFQYLGLGANELPAWILEGVPAWVGEDISGGSTISTTWWVKYLVSPQRSLYGRDYDAIGFYAHLDEVGIDPWSHIVGIFDGFSNEPAFDAAGASSGSFLESWPSSVTRRTEWGRAWDATGPGITFDRATPQPMTVTNGAVATAEVGKVSNGLYAVSIAADIVTIDVAGYARMGADDGTDEVLSSSTTYCGRAGGCVCPDGSELPYDQIAGLVTIGVTGGTQEAGLTITGSKLDCEERDGARSGRPVPRRHLGEHCVVHPRHGHRCAGGRTGWRRRHRDGDPSRRRVRHELRRLHAIVHRPR